MRAVSRSSTSILLAIRDHERVTWSGRHRPALQDLTDYLDREPEGATAHAAFGKELPGDPVHRADRLQDRRGFA